MERHGQYPHQSLNGIKGIVRRNQNVRHFYERVVFQNHLHCFMRSAPVLFRISFRSLLQAHPVPRRRAFRPEAPSRAHPSPLSARERYSRDTPLFLSVLRFRIDKVVRFRSQRTMNGEYIGLLEQFLERKIYKTQFLCSCAFSITS